MGAGKLGWEKVPEGRWKASSSQELRVLQRGVQCERAGQEVGRVGTSVGSRGPSLSAILNADEKEEAVPSPNSGFHQLLLLSHASPAFSDGYHEVRGCRLTASASRAQGRSQMACRVGRFQVALPPLSEGLRRSWNTQAASSEAGDI